MANGVGIGLFIQGAAGGGGAGGGAAVIAVCIAIQEKLEQVKLLKVAT